MPVEYNTILLSSKICGQNALISQLFVALGDPFKDFFFKVNADSKLDSKVQ